MNLMSTEWFSDDSDDARIPNGRTTYGTLTTTVQLQSHYCPKVGSDICQHTGGMMSLHFMSLHCVSLHCVSLHCVSLHCIACIASGFHLQQTLLILCFRNRWIILK